MKPSMHEMPPDSRQIRNSFTLSFPNLKKKLTKLLLSFFGRCSASQAIRRFLQNHEVLYSVHKGPSLDPILKYKIQPVRRSPTLRFQTGVKIFIQSMPKFSTNNSFPSGIQTKILCASPHTSYMPRPAHPP